MLAVHAGNCAVAGPNTEEPRLIPTAIVKVGLLSGPTEPAEPAANAQHATHGSRSEHALPLRPIPTLGDRNAVSTSRPAARVADSDAGSSSRTRHAAELTTVGRIESDWPDQPMFARSRDSERDLKAGTVRYEVANCKARLL